MRNWLFMASFSKAIAHLSPRRLPLPHTRGPVPMKPPPHPLFIPPPLLQVPPVPRALLPHLLPLLPGLHGSLASWTPLCLYFSYEHTTMLVSGAIELARCCHPSRPIGFSQNLRRQVGRLWATPSQTGRAKATGGAKARIAAIGFQVLFPVFPHSLHRRVLSDSR